MRLPSKGKLLAHEGEYPANIGYTTPNKGEQPANKGELMANDGELPANVFSARPEPAISPNGPLQPGGGFIRHLTAKETSIYPSNRRQTRRLRRLYTSETSLRVFQKSLYSLNKH